MIVRVPGDKSISQRALVLASLAGGGSRLRGLLPGDDPRSTAGALRALGAEIPVLPEDGREIVVGGRGLRGLRRPGKALDLGNSGTGTRLLLGVLAGQPAPFRAVVTGDASLRVRPMARVTGPLGAMGGRFRGVEPDGSPRDDGGGAPDRLPIRVEGGELRALEYELPVASAQVKSSLLLAGLVGGVPVLLTEPERSRDHTERMLESLGVGLVCHAAGPGWRVELRDPPVRIPPLDLTVPGDISSAAFLLALGLLGGAGEALTVEGVGLNPTRSGVLDVLRTMGGEVEVEETGTEGGEPVGRLTARPSALEGVELGRAEVTAAIDEIPVLAVLASRAQGETRITGAKELRVKETDRIRAIVENLRAVGVDAEELEDGLVVRGSDAPARGRVRAFDDHRIAMAFGVLGALGGNEIDVDDPGVVAVSYPGFWADLTRLSGGGG